MERLVNENLSLSTEGANLIKAFESCEKKSGPGRFKAYVCPAGVLTIGWGHTNDNGRKFGPDDIWSQQECDDAFNTDMDVFEKAVRRNVTVPLNQSQFDALVSFTYNVGEGNLKSSTLLKKVNAGDFEGAAHEFSKWNKGGGKVLAGLVRRRASEALLFQGIPDRDYDGLPDQGMAKTTGGHASGLT
ncbi:MAG TPA: lysozyme [Propylenella sp.]|nr:lysozyme [Propylenella sp.]